MTFGNRIAQLRSRTGLTQEELAEKIGLTRASLSHYENNRRAPDLEILGRLADFFEVTADYIMGRTNEPQTTLVAEVKEFVDNLELSDEMLLQKFRLTIDGTSLSPEEARRFIAFVRAERSMNPPDGET